MNKAMESNSLLRKLQPFSSRLSLLTKCKSFIRPHLDYGDFIYDQPSNEQLLIRLKLIQYKTALSIIRAI